MDIIEQTKQLITRHNLAANSYLDFNPFKQAKKTSYEEESDAALNKFLTPEKWNRVSEGWYGFDLQTCPPKWFEALEEFWGLLEKDSPDFKVLQTKLKYGSIRIYVDNISDDAQKAIEMLENVLQDKNLIW